MSTFKELQDLSKNMDIIQKVAPMSYDIDSFAEHLPLNVRRANDIFVANNKHVPAVLDYDELGYTEPEDERDCFANNQALLRLPELIPYLEQANKGLEDGATEKSNYSQLALHLGAEILKAKDAGFTKEQMDYLVDEAFKHDFPYFGCKHYEYDLCDARGKFLDGMSVDKVREYQNMNPAVKQAVDFYTDHFMSRNQPVPDDGVKLIASANSMDEAYGLYSHLVYDTDNVTVTQGEEIHKAIGQIIEASKDDKYNPNVTIKYEDGDTSEIPRLSSRYSEGYVDAMAEMINKDERLAQHPEKLQDLTKDFIENGGAERWISSYFEQNEDAYNKALEGCEPEATPCGGDDKNYYMFYVDNYGTYKNNTAERIAEFGKKNFPNFKDLGFEDIKNFHMYWATEGSGYESFYNGDTYVLFDDIEKLPEDKKNDAYKHCEGYKNKDIGKKMTEAIVENGLKEKKPVYINGITKFKTYGEDENKYYNVGIRVEKSMSESGFVNINIPTENLKKSRTGNSYYIRFNSDHERNAQVMKDGQKETVKLKVSDIAKSNETVRNSRRMPKQPDVKTPEAEDEISK